MSNQNDNSKERLNDQIFKKYFTILIFIYLLAIIVPYILVNLNHSINHCNHHTSPKNGLDGVLWILGRSLGFSLFISFVITSYVGYKMRPLAKKFHAMKKARFLHHFSSIITLLLLSIHVLALVFSEPWNSLIFEFEKNHFPLTIFLLKLWTGIIFGIMMTFLLIFFFLLREPKKMRKFGYKRFIFLHRVMMIATILLAIHIFLLNTELVIMFYG